MLISLFLSAFVALSSPQTDSISYWNGVLECYERLCDACIGNKDSKTIANIKGELDLLLKDPVGKMNGEQQQKFERIRARYQGVNIGNLDRNRIDTIVVIKQIPVEKIREIDHIVVYDTISVNDKISTVVVEHQYSRKDTTIVIHTLRPGANETSAIATGSALNWFVGATAGFAPHFSAGIMVGGGTTGGIYLKARSNFKKINAEYSVDTGQQPFWSTGTAQTSRLVVCAGGLFTLYKGLKMYLGAGYGEKCHYLQDTNERWAEVSNATVRSYALDLGLMYCWKRITIFGGANTTAFKYTDGEVGIAVSFGK